MLPSCEGNLINITLGLLSLFLSVSLSLPFHTLHTLEVRGLTSSASCKFKETIGYIQLSSSPYSLRAGPGQGEHVCASDPSG